MSQPPVLNIYRLSDPQQRERGEKYHSLHFDAARKLGAVKLGYHVTVLPPGKRAFPYHFHYVNEELFLILSGTGSLRWPGGNTPLEPGDLIACPPGPASAHQIVNTGAEDLRYLSLSTAEPNEIVEYPDSGKFGAYAGREAGKPFTDAAFHIFAPRSAAVDYWDGEE